MCFFKKKNKKEPITGNKYQVGQTVRFRYKGEICPGYIYEVKQDDNKNIIYDVQIGGECPAIIVNIKEEEIFISSKK